MRGVRICGGSGERNRKGRLPRASRGCPVSVVRREQRISQPQLKSAAAVEISRLRSRGNNVPAPRRRLSPVVQKTAVLKTTMLKTAVLKTTVLVSNFLERFSRATVFSNTASVHPAHYPGSREVRRSALLPFSARATFHPDCTVGTGFSPVRPLLRAGVSSGVLASCADAKIRTILPACESGSRAVTAGSEFHRPRSTMSILIMPQRTQLV